MKLKEELNKFTLIDVLFIGYMVLFSILILFFHNGVAGWGFYILVHFAIIYLIIHFVPILASSESGFLKFLRWFYPVILFVFNYKEINSFTHIIFNDWVDLVVMNFEKYIFGVHPTLWMEKFTSPLLTEIMKFDYFTYYLMVWVSAGVLYVKGSRRDYVRFLSTVCIAFYICYIGFIFFPVRGPRYTIYDKYTKDYEVTVKDYYGPFVENDVADKKTMALDGYFFTDMQDSIMRYGSLHGGCMPSSHVAVAFVCLMMMWLYKRKIFYVYLPLVSLLCVSVVYNRYHYISDVIAGLIVGVFSLFLTPILLVKWNKFSKGESDY